MSSKQGQVNPNYQIQTVLAKIGWIVLRDPRQVLAFLVAAALVIASSFSLMLYGGQFLAAGSQLFPQVFDQRLVTTPRAPFVLPAVTALVLGASLWIVFATTLAIQLADAAFDDRTVSIWPTIWHSVRLVPRTSVLLSILVISVGVGLSLFVVPGVYLLVRTFAALPALVVGRRSPTDAVRESWRRTGGFEELIVVLLVVLAALAAALSLIPTGGYFLAVSLVVPATLAATVFVYRIGATDWSGNCTEQCTASLP